jgi:hypothetical protein
LLTLKPNADEKTKKHISYSNCDLEFHFTSSSGLGGSICQKKVKIVILLKGLFYYMDFGVVKPKKRGVQSGTNQIVITLHTIPRSYGSGSGIWNPVLFDPWLWDPG